MSDKVYFDLEDLDDQQLTGYQDTIFLGKTGRWAWGILYEFTAEIRGKTVYEARFLEKFAKILLFFLGDNKKTLSLRRIFWRFDGLSWGACLAKIRIYSQNVK